MKTSIVVPALLASGLLSITAGPYQVVERGANYRVWQKTTVENSTNRVHKYIELSSGLCHTNANGQLVDSKEEIEIYPQGAIARGGAYQVIFDNNLNSAGAIDLRDQHGTRLRSSILGLAYADHASGNVVLIAQIQDSQGELISSNQVLYPDALVGPGVKASVKYTYKRGSFSQDVILETQPPSCESLGLNPKSTEIEVLTEFLDSPQPSVVANPVKGDALPDEEISWDVMRLGRGKAFELGEPRSGRARVAVRRQFISAQGRNILVEGVPLKSIQASLAKLPLQASTATKLPLLASKTLVLPPTPPAPVESKPMKLALASPSDKGFVLDYNLVNSAQSDFTFASGQTYFISGYFSLSGITTFGAGTVVKFPEDGSGAFYCPGTVVCATTPSSPAVFTSENDDSAGEVLPWSSGSPAAFSCGNGLGIYNSVELDHCRFSYFGTAVTTYRDAVLNDVQFYQCSWGIVPCGDVQVNNTLASSCYIFCDASMGCYNSAFENGFAAADGTSTFCNCTFSGMQTDVYDIQSNGATANYSCDADSDYDSLPDSWELQYFGNLNQSASGDPDGDGLSNLQEYQHGTDPTKFDTDGDGLSDSEELTILLDANNPGLGYLDPLNPDTGGTGIPDGQKDSDHDGISNLGELRTYQSNPSNAHTFNSVNNDAAYLFTANNGGNATKSFFTVTYDFATRLLRFSIYGGFANGTYDLYFANDVAVLGSGGTLRWQSRRVYTGIQCDSSGNAVFEMMPPDPLTDYFEILYAGDADGDGLTDGYEAWFNYNGQHTGIDNRDTDNDQMEDGWEVEYGLDPTLSTSPNGTYDNPDGDTIVNLDEFYSYYWGDGSYDPLKAYGTPANRPIVIVVADNPYPSCEQSSFTFYRYGGNYDSPLTVYYSVGGTLNYDAGDYNLTPAPPNWPRIYSATIPVANPNAGIDGHSVTVTVDAPGVSPNPDEVETLNVSVTPYGVSVVPQVSDPYSWAYVVDWQTWNRQTITFDNHKLRPSAMGQTVQTCPGDPPKQITLTGGDSCGASLTFSIVNPPSHGSLSAITPINGTSASVTYTRSGSFCGADSFTFKVNDGVRDSAPATVIVDVGDPNPTINPQEMRVMMGKNSTTPKTFTFTGSDSCGDTLTFAPIPGQGPNHGTLGAINPIDASHATVNYTPNNGFEGMDNFAIGVNSCGFSSQSPAQITVFVVAGPQLTTQCNPYETETGVGVPLSWSLDAIVQQMEQQDGLNIKDFKIYRSAAPGGPYTLIHTTSDGSQTTYWDGDTTLVSGQTYYYVATFEYQGSDTIYESPYSNEISATAEPPNNLVGEDASWDVTHWESLYKDDPDNIHSYPINRIHGGLWQAPFGDPSDYASSHPQLPPLPPLFPVDALHPWQEQDPISGQFIYWSNHITLNLTGYTSEQLAQVEYSIAIDNSYDLYLNSQKIDSARQIGGIRLPFQPLNRLNNLVAGLNEIGVVIWGDGEGGSYFSMVVTANACGGP